MAWGGSGDGVGDELMAVPGALCVTVYVLASIILPNLSISQSGLCPLLIALLFVKTFFKMFLERHTNSI